MEIVTSPSLALTGIWTSWYTACMLQYIFHKLSAMPLCMKAVTEERHQREQWFNNVPISSTLWKWDRKGHWTVDKTLESKSWVSVKVKHHLSVFTSTVKSWLKRLPSLIPRLFPHLFYIKAPHHRLFISLYYDLSDQQFPLVPFHFCISTTHLDSSGK